MSSTRLHPLEDAHSDLNISVASPATASRGRTSTNSSLNGTPRPSSLLTFDLLDLSDAVPLSIPGPGKSPASSVSAAAGAPRSSTGSLSVLPPSTSLAATSPFSPTRAQTPTERIFKELRSVSSLLLGGNTPGGSVGNMVSAVAGSRSSFGSSSVVNADAGRQQKLASNVDENILFCIDLHDENGQPLNPAEQRSRLDETKQLLKRFIYLKRMFKPSHKFGIITLESKAQMYMVPSTDLEFLSMAIDNLSTTGSFHTFDMSSLFTLIQETLHVDSRDNDQVVRIIMLYSRSNVFPDMSTDAAMNALYATKRVFFDLIYIHDPPSDDTFPQEIYNAFVTYRVPPDASWFFEVSRSWNRLAKAFTRLLAHPQQRPHQNASA
ncbi:hypothetical protein H9P43_004120 [Blastocladiella emersonii ATCC 22665]|nr:hypothetical protein H9P43_004120 [Blastocladiella emersonii ATCC 22665]